MDFDQVIYLQFVVSNEYMRRHKLTPKQFLELDEKKHILRYVAIGYESFHLTGLEGIMEDVEEYISVR